ncbi:hypothetical protein Pan161_61110 [Gimesia algae]|uniref:Uncharacterized protein n=1 Tax=Gimesia algae TaxID=2527971 RepID=A0A517VN42_9PLAN|nr:hypothetical protein Pan161_61110 [Gimesia algae]
MIELKTADLPKALVKQMEGPEPPEYFISNGCS